eukprot:Tbor_TRINITY_DN4529_c0_g1::TRINITY_DN4529_c0_g1_i1::g.15708::m.15708
MSHHNVPRFQKGSRQTHMNRTKFEPNRYKDSYEQLDKSFLEVMTSLCCRKCCDQIQWKVDYGKYTPLERPKKCNICNQKTIAIAYHHICQECSKVSGECAKCQKLPGDRGKPGQSVEGKGGTDLTASSALQTVQEEDSNSDTEEMINRKRITDNHVLAKYMFVDDPVEDEEFKHLQGLDIRRLVEHKRRVLYRKEKDDRQYMKERQRRTLIRQDKKNREADGDEGEDSDEVI